jgi:hypothetical protein
VTLVKHGQRQLHVRVVSKGGELRQQLLRGVGGPFVPAPQPTEDGQPTSPANVVGPLGLVRRSAGKVQCLGIPPLSQFGLRSPDKAACGRPRRRR